MSSQAARSGAATGTQIPHPQKRKLPAGTLYRGREGMWSWVLHRITGVAIFFFLLVHILDTSLVRISPEAYNAVIGTYKTPIMGLGEVALVAAIGLHALNGLRIICIDFCAWGPRAQRLMFWIVIALWIVLLAGFVPRQLMHIFGGECDEHPDHRRPAQPATSATGAGASTSRSGAGSTCASRASLLVVLIFGHLFVNLLPRRAACSAIDFAFVAGKLAEPVLDRLGHAAALARPHPRRQRHAHAHQRLRARPLPHPCCSCCWASRPSSCSCSARSCSPPSTPASPRHRERRLIARCAVQE